VSFQHHYLDQLCFTARQGNDWSSDAVDPVQPPWTSRLTRPQPATGRPIEVSSYGTCGLGHGPPYYTGVHVGQCGAPPGYVICHDYHPWVYTTDH